MLSVICKDVRKEPTFSTTPDSNDELRADINVRSFEHRLQRAFVDVNVFLPLRSKLSEPIASNNNKDNGKPKEKNIQPANLRW